MDRGTTIWMDEQDWLTDNRQMNRVAFCLKTNALCLIQQIVTGSQSQTNFYRKYIFKSALKQHKNKG